MIEKRAIKSSVFVDVDIFIAYNVKMQMIKIFISKEKIFMDMEKIYSKVAEDNGVSTGEVRRAIQEAIKDAYTNPQNSSETVRAYQRRVPCKGEIPTPEELISYLSGEIAGK